MKNKKITKQIVIDVPPTVVNVREGILGTSEEFLRNIITQKIGHQNWSIDRMPINSCQIPSIDGMVTRSIFFIEVGLPPQVAVRRKWKQRNKKEWR